MIQFIDTKTLGYCPSLTRLNVTMPQSPSGLSQVPIFVRVHGQLAGLEVLWYGENSLGMGAPRVELRQIIKAVPL
jgi:hypothetical protein